MLPKEIIEKRILISVLNWGMGHVSRSIGLIHQLIEQRSTIFIACSDAQKKIYEEYFDSITFIEHSDYPFQFDGKGNFGWDLTKKISSLQRRLSKERDEVELLVDEYQIDVVISDHRYGFRSDKVHSIVVTHQFNLPVKWYQCAINSVHRKLLFTFDSIWIMDDSTSRLAGKLSVSKQEKKMFYVGVYSRFMLYDIEKVEKNNSTVLIASGPKIYAQQLVNEVLSKGQNEPIIVICEDEIQVPKNATKICGSWREQDQIILSAQKIISRSGYSTIMDVDFLKCKAEFIPTPGQAEQIYLSKLNY